MKEATYMHTAEVLLAVEKVGGLLTLSTRFSTYIPFVICMIANMTITHLRLSLRFPRAQTATRTRKDQAQNRWFEDVGGTLAFGTARVILFGDCGEGDPCVAGWGDVGNKSDNCLTA
jgi:hypothetical protein